MPKGFESASAHPSPQKIEGEDVSKVTASEERPTFDEFEGGELDERGEFKEPTPEEQEKFRDRVARMSEVLEDADFTWYLDGATNISLYGDQMIRNHKDLDMSVFQEDLGKLEDLLNNQGFGIFVNYKEDRKELMRKVTAQELGLLENPDVSICKVGPDGTLSSKNSHEAFDFVDLHIRDIDEFGDVVVGYSGISIPKEYFEPIRKELPNGKIISLSHPAVVAYHKLHSTRAYDVKDLQILSPLLTQEDIAMLRSSVEKEAGVLDKRTREVLKEVWGELSPVLETAPDPDTIAEKLRSHPEIGKRNTDESVANYISSISQYLSENPSVTADDFISQSISILNIKKRAEEQIKLIDQLEQ
ncbi:hypothetical protein CL653_00450 [bacterium]|nr:hypothetical protein [bacterium]